ncbi:TPA: hypothetical protein ACKRZL_001024 [Pseudomonas aeruginosa]|uniref:hypothetical protein n=1 Tax=Pseudomonas sp. NBRC 111135 TaxID=1661050 RepID=UPI0012E1D16B|nr:hypothetical protein [Pseudomonas sp. NBRC 111135]HEP8341118.1 hypothetical protein [Pseudomonas aeruginosa]
MESIGKGLSRIVGKVSNVQSSVHTVGNVKTGPVTGNVSGNISSHDQFTFRVNGSPVSFTHEGGMNIADGDEVVVIGKVKKGQLEAYALKNLETKASYDQYSPFHLVLAWIGIFISAGLIAVLIGILFTPYTIYILLGTLKRKYAAEQVSAYTT